MTIQKRTTDILLVYPPITKQERYSSSLGSAGGEQIPLGVFYLASYLREQGFCVSVLDCEAMNLTNNNVIEQLRAENCGVLGISSTTVAFHRALSLAQSVKTTIPETTVIIGGPHVSSQPTHPMEFEEFDFAIQNEGEETLTELLKAMDAGETPEAIPGLIFRKNGKTIVNDRRPYIKDLDSLPLPAYDLVSDFTRYTPPPCNYKKAPVANVMTSRGCPYECTFCPNETFGRQLRLRSAQNVVTEIELLMTKYGVREIAFVDDTFTLTPDRIHEIFDLARSKGLRFPWTCMARINTVDGDLLRYMKGSGCWHISFGIESGDKNILKEIRKKIDLDDVEPVIRSCRKLGILTKGFFIVGHPLESIESINKSIDLALRLDLNDVVVTLNTPIPGSYQFANVEKYGTLDKTNWTKFNCWNPVFVPNGLTKEQLVAKHREFYRRFYLRPRIIWRYFLSMFSATGLRRFVSILSASLFLFKKRKS